MAPEQGLWKNRWGSPRSTPNHYRQQGNTDSHYYPNNNYRSYNYQRHHREWTPPRSWRTEEIPEHAAYNTRHYPERTLSEYWDEEEALRRRDTEELIRMATQITEALELLASELRKNNASRISKNTVPSQGHFSGMETALALRPLEPEQNENELPPFAGILPLGEAPPFLEINKRLMPELEEDNAPMSPPAFIESPTYDIYEPLTPEGVTYDSTLGWLKTQTETKNSENQESEFGTAEKTSIITETTTLNHKDSGRISRAVSPEIREIGFPHNQVTLYVSYSKNANTQTEQAAVQEKGIPTKLNDDDDQNNPPGQESITPANKPTGVPKKGTGKRFRRKRIPTDKCLRCLQNNNKIEKLKHQLLIIKTEVKQARQLAEYAIQQTSRPVRQWVANI